DGWVLVVSAFAVRPGETAAFFGHTGAGTTPSINLITRFYDPRRGQVLVDGVDIRHHAQRELRRHVGLVLQDVFLFSGTGASNIRLGNTEITDDEIRKAAEFVSANRFIEALRAGYATGVVERGAALSR